LQNASYKDAYEKVAAGNFHVEKWRSGSRKPSFGDRAFILKAGEEPRGIIASGIVISDQVYEEPHFDPEKAKDGKKVLRADIELDRILDKEKPLLVFDINKGPLVEDFRARNTISSKKFRNSGWKIKSEAAARELEVRWVAHLASIDGTGGLSPDEAEDGDDFVPQFEDRRAAVLRAISERKGQKPFIDALRKRYGDRCMISGCELMDVVEAAHIKPYQNENDNNPANGLLLRADLHTLFDLYLIGIEPDTLIVRVCKHAKQSGYEHFDGLPLICGNKGPNKAVLAFRWESFSHIRK
jgi:hypothetical protein